MLIKTAKDIAASEVTDEAIYLQRRKFMLRAVSASSAMLLPQAVLSATGHESPSNCLEGGYRGAPAGEKLNSFEEITNYNNFYEYSTNKEAVAKLAENFKARPWTLTIEGEVEKPRTYDIDRLIRKYKTEERIYRLRCVEGWSMVIPWQGFPLCQLLREAKPTSRAKYVQFVSKLDPDIFYGQRRQVFEWPYQEGLRIDEAMHPLTLLATGLYGKEMPAQNGAPIRLVVPWKYGFKSIKSIVAIRLVFEQPTSSWSTAVPLEYGFYANVNPKVSHPRWSQSREIRIGELRKRKTLMFNGYAEQVAQLYTGMDLKKYF